LFFLWLSSIPGGAVVKNPPSNGGDARDAGPILGLGRSEVENDNPLQYSCVKNPMDREAWRTTVHGVATSWTWLSDWVCMCTHTHTHPSFIDEDNEVQISRIPVPMAAGTF